MRSSTGQLAKTDAIDARVLAHFADAIRPEVRQISDESSRQLKDLVQRRRQISDEERLILSKPVLMNTLNG